MNRPRGESETYPAYLESQKQEEQWLKGYLRGRVLWPASLGTYTRKKHGPLK